jgi:dTDP-4-dehydrorhamnose reductase
MIRLAATNETVSVVDDQHGQPTWTGDLAAQIVALLDADAPAGIYHGTNSGETTWFGFAQAVFSAAGLNPDRVTPTDSSRFVRPAPRPSYSVLGHAAWNAIGLEPMRDWNEALADAARHGVLEQHDNPESGR